MGGFDRAPHEAEEPKRWKISKGLRQATHQLIGRTAWATLWVLSPHPGAGVARWGRHTAPQVGARVAGPGGPALPAAPEILPPAHATRARNAPAARTWCNGARRRRWRRRLPQRGPAGHQHPTPARSPAHSPPPEAPAVPAQPEPRAHLTSRAPPRPAAGPTPRPRVGPAPAPALSPGLGPRGRLNFMVLVS